MISFGAAVGETVVSSIEPIDAIIDVVGGMRVNQIDDNPDSKTVSCVDQILKVVRGTRPRRYAKESRNMISETRIVRVLLNGHELNDIIPSIFDPLKIVLRVVSVRTDPPKLLRHAYMRFINPHTLMLYLNWFWVLPLVSCRWIPEHAIEKISIFVLDLVG